MKKTNKKGFTIVELVIVIAVIAILAGVLIPTFSGVVQKANESKALQGAKNAYTQYFLEVDGTIPEILVIKSNGSYFKFENGQITTTPLPDANYNTGKTGDEQFENFPTLPAAGTGFTNHWKVLTTGDKGYVKDFDIFVVNPEPTTP